MICLKYIVLETTDAEVFINVFRRCVNLKKKKVEEGEYATSASNKSSISQNMLFQQELD